MKLIDNFLKQTEKKEGKTIKAEFHYIICKYT